MLQVQYTVTVPYYIQPAKPLTAADAVPPCLIYMYFIFPANIIIIVCFVCGLCFFPSWQQSYHF